MVESWPQPITCTVEMGTETWIATAMATSLSGKWVKIGVLSCFVNMLYVVLWFLRLSMQGPSSTQFKHALGLDEEIDH